MLPCPGDGRKEDWRKDCAHPILGKHAAWVHCVLSIITGVVTVDDDDYDDYGDDGEDDDVDDDDDQLHQLGA